MNTDSVNKPGPGHIPEDKGPVTPKEAKSISPTEEKLSSYMTRTFPVEPQEFDREAQLREEGGSVGEAASKIFPKTSISERLVQCRMIQNEVKEIESMLTDVVDEGEMDWLRDQLMDGLTRVANNGDEWKNVAREANRALYLRPESGKGKVDASSESQDALYKSCHIQVNPNGTIYLIPKHPNLFLGSGSAKKVRLAIELTEDYQPRRLVAFVSQKLDLPETDVEDAKYFAEKEVDLIKVYIDNAVKEEDRVDVRFTMYREDELSAGKGEKGKYVLPFANLGDLQSAQQKGKLTDDEIPKVMKGAVELVQIMHVQMGIANLDIKPANILVHRDEDGEIHTLAYDYGLAEDARSSIDYEKGTKMFRAPEIVIEDFYDVLNADIYSLGVTLYELQNKEHLPSFILKDKAVEEMNQEEKDEYSLAVKEGWEAFEPKDDFEVLIKAMTNPDPGARPIIRKVKEVIDVIQRGGPDVSSKVDKILSPPKRDFTPNFFQNMFGM